MSKWDKIIKSVTRSIIFTIFCIIVCGIFYTMIVTAIGQIFFNYKANGSILKRENDIICGSNLLGQKFSSKRYMWGRYEETSNTNKKFLDSKGKQSLYCTASNLSPASIKYSNIIKDRVKKIKNAHTEKDSVSIPVELVTSSGSGLDPHISYKSAIYQVERIASARDITYDDVKSVIDMCKQDNFLGLFGDEKVNVLKVNLYLDKFFT